MLNDCSEDAPMALYPERALEESLAGTGLRRLVGHGREQLAQDETAEAYESCEPALHAPQRWGLSVEAVAHLGERLYQFWRRFRGGFTTRTRDTSEHAYDYLRAQLTMDPERNFVTRLGRLSAKFGVPKKCCSLKSTGCGNDLEKHPYEFLS